MNKIKETSKEFIGMENIEAEIEAVMAFSKANKTGKIRSNLGGGVKINKTWYGLTVRYNGKPYPLDFRKHQPDTKTISNMIVAGMD